MILKCAPQLGNIDTIKRFLEFFLDPKFIAREQIKLRTLAGKKYYSAIIPVKIHPAIAILDCLNFLIQNDPLTLPKDFEYYMRDLIVLSLTASSMFKVSNNDLNKLGPPGFIKRVRDRILDKRGFYHVLYELQVAALMNSIHKIVHFEDVSDKKWPDLLISEADKSYYLECKSLESPKALYARLSVEILQLLEKMKINAQIELLLNRQPSDSTAITTITAEIQSMLQSGTMQKCDESKADIKITLLDNLYKGDLISPGGNADYDYLAIGSWGKRDSDGISWWKDPWWLLLKTKIALHQKEQ
jgi:hypothetical protein